MKFYGAKLWIYLTGLDMCDLTWMMHSRMPLVWKFMHKFWTSCRKILIRKRWPIFKFFFKNKKWMRHGQMPLVWKWMHDFLKSWFFFFFWKRWWWWWWSSSFFSFFFFFLKMNEAWLNAPSLQTDAWLLKTLIVLENVIFFFFF